MNMLTVEKTKMNQKEAWNGQFKKQHLKLLFDRFCIAFYPLWQCFSLKRFQSPLFFLKNGPTPASFSFIFGLFKQTSLQFLQQIYVEKMSIQFTLLGFEPTTFGT